MLEQQKELVPSFWDFNQWLAGHVVHNKVKKSHWIYKLYNEPEQFKKTVYRAALNIKGLGPDGQLFYYNSLSDEQKDRVATDATGVCNAFLGPLERSCKELAGQVQYKYNPNNRLHDFELTISNVFSPLNRDGENADGDENEVLLTVKAATANKARNYLLRALETVEAHIKRNA